MKPGSFILNGVYSENIGTVIQARPRLSTPKRRVTLKQTFGKDGSLPYDEEAYDNTELELTMHTSGASAMNNRDVIFNLFNKGEYMDLILYSDPTKIYKVLMSEPPSFDSIYYMGESITYQIKLTVSPYKYLLDNHLISIPSADISQRIVINPTLYTAKPYFVMYGFGDGYIYLNGKSFVIEGISGHIVVNSAMMMGYRIFVQPPLTKEHLQNGIYNSMLNENRKIKFREYPILNPGENVISWSGDDITNVDMLPQWRSLT